MASRRSDSGVMTTSTFNPVVILISSTAMILSGSDMATVR